MFVVQEWQHISKMVMLSLSVSRELICIFLLSSIMNVLFFLHLLGTIKLISWRFNHVVQLQLLGFSHPLIDLYYFFVSTEVFYSYLDDILNNITPNILLAKQNSNIFIRQAFMMSDLMMLLQVWGKMLYLI